MVMDRTAFNDAVIAQFGEPVTVTVGAVQTSINAAFLAPYKGDTVGNVAIERLDPELRLTDTVWTALGAAQGDTVSVRGITYTIAEIRPIYGGMVTLVLRAY